jgi:Fur family ferric uptake transcriptional regulator
MRNTQARQLILEFLKERRHPTSAKEIVEHVAGTRPEINKSTVYRFIKALNEDGQLKTIHVPGRGAVYEMRSNRPHYHFSCERCDTVVCMGRDSSTMKLLVPRGYSVSSEQLVLSGLCPSCKAS